MELDEADVVFFLIVVKGAAHVRSVINHGKAAGHAGQKGALNAHGEQHDAENQIKQIVGKRGVMQHRIDCKHDGCRATQARPGHQTNLPGPGPERGQDCSHCQRPPHQCEKDQNTQRWNKDTG